MKKQKKIATKSPQRKSQNDFLFELKSLTHRFQDGTLGLNNIDLCLYQNDFVVITGCNGSGKTTLLKHLNGLLIPTTGHVILKGIDVSKDLLRARQLVGMVFQDAESQIVGETVREDVAFGPNNLSLEKKVIDQRVQDALEQVGLMDLADKPPYLLSGGEKRRLAIAGVLAMKSCVIMFDEPFSNLDYPGTRQVLQQMRHLHQDGHTVIVATHELDAVLRPATRLIIMQKGKIVSDGLPQDVVGDAFEFDIKIPDRYHDHTGSDQWLS